MADAYNPSFESQRSYTGWSVVAKPGVGVDTPSTTVDRVFASEQEAQDWIAQHGPAWAQEITQVPGQSSTHHRSL